MKSLQFASGLLVAVAAGFAVGILTAPRSGKSTRRKLLIELLKQKMDLEDKMEASFDEMVDAANLKTDQIKRSAGKRLKSALHRNH